MTKIPVTKTIAHAYKFVFRNFFALISIMWLSWALMLALTFLSRGSIAILFQISVTRDFSQLQGHWGQLLLTYLAIFVLLFVQLTGLTRLSLGLAMPSRYYYFSLGRPVWRLIGAALLAALAVAAVVIAYGLAIFVLGVLARVFMNAHPSVVGNAIVALLAAAALLIGYCGFIFVTVRFFFLLAPVSVAEEKISIGRVWLLTNGNFWRIFLISLSIIIPFMVIEILGVISIAGPMPFAPHGNSPEQILAFQQAQQVWQLTYSSRLQKYWYLVYPVAALMSVFLYGLSCAAQSFAYQQLTQPETSSPISAD
jgi:hypothetical protein